MKSVLTFLTAVLLSSAAAQSGQVLRVAVATDPGNLNPHDYSSNFVALTSTYEGLVHYGPNGVLQPALATHWTTDSTGKILTFTLRQGVTFHDGTPFNAGAARWNVQRWLNKDHSWLKINQNIERVETLNANTLRLVLRQPDSTTLQQLTLARPLRFLSPASVDAGGRFTREAGTGPWQFASAQPGQRLVLKPYPRYWSGVKPTLSEVSFEVIPDPQTRVNALLAGQVDVIGGENLGTLAVEQVPLMRLNSQVKLISAPGTTTYLLQMNTTRAPWNDVRVRQAVNLGIDRNSLSNGLFAGLATPATGLLPPTLPDVFPGQPSAYRYDEAAARTLLKQAGWIPGPGGVLQKGGAVFSVTLLAQQNMYPQQKLLAEALQAQLRRLGIQLKLQIANNDAFYKQVQSGDYDVATQLTWGAPYDPYSSIQSMLTGRNRSGGRVLYTDGTLDRLVNAALGESSRGRREAAYRQLWTYADRQAAGIPLLFSSRLYAVGARVQGFQPGDTEYDLDFSRIHLEP